MSAYVVHNGKNGRFLLDFVGAPRGGLAAKTDLCVGILPFECRAVLCKMISRATYLVIGSEGFVGPWIMVPT